MNSQEIAHSLITYISENSGFEPDRDYLGMSNIGKCPREIYNLYFETIKPTPEMHRNSFRGYMYEREIITGLINKRLLENFPGEETFIIAPFDDRFKGHVDGRFVTGELLEIKSVSKRKYEHISNKNRLPYYNYMQIQCYMKYGHFPSCFCVIVCTETTEINVLEIKPNSHVQQEVEAKAKMLLRCIDNRNFPDCTCGKCKGGNF